MIKVGTVECDVVSFSISDDAVMRQTRAQLTAGRGQSSGAMFILPDATLNIVPLLA